MLILSGENTKELYQKVKSLEKDISTGKSDIEVVVKETRRLYSQVRTVERTVYKVERIVEMFGVAMPAIGMVGPYAFIFMIAFQVANLVAQIVTAEEREKQRIERDNAIREIRREIFKEASENIERERRESYRSVVP